MSLPPGSAEAEKAAGNTAFKEGRYEPAVLHFTNAITIDSSNGVLYSNRSGANASLGRYGAALEDAEWAVSLRP